ncbi:hypothetical protein B0J13DRAFT_491250 [Dactylonectria estremocensis]|uniref:PH domain-containing protein n=1 Tax=Dactylonectria estremocensis TaxID=1079267 RepID=A0A9P9FH47_9HYPO|nr:hypothetical protein B0J13DRAFT_491250 [Dactylonectria estremocensis]
MPDPPGSTASVPMQASNAIPVGLNEAALDSPTFRVTAANFAEQVDAIERWLNGYVGSTTRLLHDFLALEETINTYLAKTVPSAADGVVDNDYTFLALKRVGDGWRDYWMHMVTTMKQMDNSIVEPIRNFITGDLRHFKECRKALDNSQRIFDSTLARYVSQSKTKEPSALREDAFAVYETRKVYLKASMDYCQLAPQLRFTLDKLIVKICTERWKEMKRSREAVSSANVWNQEMDRIHGWSKEMEASEGTFRRELQVARRDLGETTLAGFKPSRELEDYSTSTVPFLGSRGPVNMRLKDGASVVSEKQGWLFLRTLSGKPARHAWVRRWYYCRDGIFGWLIPGPLGVLQGDEIGVLLCNAKPAVGEERRFCLEVKTKSQTILLQAETQGELTEWLEVFEVTKKRAFETTINRGNTNVPGAVDPAFSISPPSIPEFSAKTLDAQTSIADDSGLSYDRSSTLPVPGPDGGLSARQSFDINGSLTRRSITALGRDLAREEGESGREHAARIIQKLDLHRKATFGSINAEAAHGSGIISAGAAGLISSSNSLLPGYPNTFAAVPGSPRQTHHVLPAVDTLTNSLAPLTLAKPPSMTALSRIAVLAVQERRPVGNNRKLPASVVANYWGSNVWGAVNAAPQPVLPRLDDDDPIGVVVPGTSQASLGKGQQQTQVGGEVFPYNYPAELKAQHAQFRLLFPDAPLEEKLVLVFCAAWSSSSAQGSGKPDMAGDGRIYVTPDNMYFYGQQIGLVTAYSISLDIITEVTAAPGKDCDFIFLHLGDDANETGYTRITIKVFLEELGLLHTRLNLLVDDLQAEEPMEVQAIITALTNLAKEDFDRPSPSVESWEEVSANTPIDDMTSSGKPVGRLLHDFSPRLRPSRLRSRPDHKIQLPTQAVEYEPEGMTEMAVERNFELSAKACFHVLFGDKSFVFPKLYFERRAQQIAQGPWALVDQGRMKRDFQFQVDYKDVLGRSKTATVNDYQVIDVFSDHVTYVVTHVKTAWHLPHSSWFKVITKIVITHVAKSKCKLAIYTKIDWSTLPTLSKNLVERQALHDAASDAEELAEVATDQVRKLGARSRTNRAIQVYGQVGQQTEVVVFSPATKESTKKQVIKPRTLTAMVFETIRSLGESAVSSLIMWAIAALQKVFGVITAHRFIIGLLAFSTLTNVLITSSEISTWWGERRAVGFMQGMGIRPNTMMSKAVYIADLSEASGAAGQELSFPQNSTCFNTFKELLDATDMDSPWEDAGSALSAPSSQATARRLRRTRQRLGSYRHDLLVAMRVVNSVEREMLQSEWENWLIDEKSLCDDLDVVLRSQSDKAKGGNKKKRNGSPQKVMEAMSAERRRELEEWRDSHCGSCMIDHQAVMRQRKLTMVRAGCSDVSEAALAPPPNSILFHRTPIDSIMAKHHEPLSAMGPVDWDAVSKDDIKDFLEDVFVETQTVVESIPATPPKAAAASTGRARSKTESAVAVGNVQRASSQRQTAVAIGQAEDLRKEWKEVKSNPRDNPLGISVYKLSAKDGRGSWFARRSVHEGLTFDDWKNGLDKEFLETMKVQGAPGSGNIRGIGADKRVESRTIENVGQLQVFQLSAQFPGPTAPRDFVTLLLTSETSAKSADGSRPLRQFMIVSKPCEHPECPPRQGIIRGYYESVELIREIPIEIPAAQRSLSSTDLGRDESMRRGTVYDVHGTSPAATDEAPTAIEWIMITRSDPGGSVPRFLIEKGTPPGIIGDAGKFLRWVTSMSVQGFEKPSEDDVTQPSEAIEMEGNKALHTPDITTTNVERGDEKLDLDDEDAPVPISNGLYGIISGAFGAASSLVAATGLLRIGTFSDVTSNDSFSDAQTIEEEHREDQSVASDSSSVRSFASALERSVTEEKSPESTTETQSETSKSNIQASQGDKELRKLQERRRKLDEKVAKIQQRRTSKLLGDKEKDQATIAKLHEKHDREIAKQEEKYRRELRKLEEKRESEQRKAEERRRKAHEREEKANMTLELEKIRAERDLAQRQISILEGQVGELQAQNTMLVRKLGKMGLIERSDSALSLPAESKVASPAS